MSAWVGDADPGEPDQMSTPTLSARLARFGFKHGFTGGSCDAYILVLPDGSEVWITLADVNGAAIPTAPIHSAEHVLVGGYPVRPNGDITEQPMLWWEGRLDDFLSKLVAAESELTQLARSMLADPDCAFIVEDREAHKAYDAAYESSDGDVVEAMHAAMWARRDLRGECARLLGRR